MVPIFHARIDEHGKFSLDERERNARLAYFRTLAGKPVEITVRKTRSKRTDLQNRYYFGIVVALLSEATGYEPDEMHELMAMKFLRIEDDPLTGSPRRKRTPKTDTAEFAEYVNQVIRFAAVELGLYIPSSDEVAA